MWCRPMIDSRGGEGRRARTPNGCWSRRPALVRSLRSLYLIRPQLNIDVSRTQMHPDPIDYFEYRMTQLEDYFGKPRVLGVYDVGAWLRQLLLDETPLLDVVNRELRMRIVFEVNTIPEPFVSDLAATHGIVHLGAGLSPNLVRLPAATRRLTRDQFLREPILFTAHEQISTRDMIVWAANKAGGVHFDPKPDGTTLQLNRLMRAADTKDNPVLGSTIIGIARVAFDAAAPLRAALNARDG